MIEDKLIVDLAEKRESAFKAIVGSWNYNLNDENSDEDYKVFVYPTFNDLYNGNMFSTAVITDSVDVSIHDIRKLPILWWKANINFLEVMFSQDMVCNDRDLNDFILSYKNDVAKMNLPYLFDACVGMHMSKIKNLYKGTETTKPLVEKFGYDTKEALHAYRLLDFLERYYEDDFDYFLPAIWYAQEERDFMMAIKHGELTAEEYLQLVMEKKEKVLRLEPIYKAHKPNEELYREMNGIIKDIVRDKLLMV